MPRATPRDDLASRAAPPGIFRLVCARPPPKGHTPGTYPPPAGDINPVFGVIVSHNLIICPGHTPGIPRAYLASLTRGGRAVPRDFAVYVRPRGGVVQGHARGPARPRGLGSKIDRHITTPAHNTVREHTAAKCIQLGGKFPRGSVKRFLGAGFLAEELDRSGN